MRLSALISPGTRELLERLRPHLDVSIDLFDGSLNPQLPERSDPVSQRLRTLTRGTSDDMTATEDRAATETRERLLAAMRTANTQLFTCGGLRIGSFPLRHDRAVVGVLVAADLARAADRDDWIRPEADTRDRAGSGAPSGEGPYLPFGTLPTAPRPGPDLAPASWVPARDAVDDPVAGRIERLGWSLRATIEADIELHGRLDSERQQSRWLATTLRFFEHLHSCRSEREMAQMLIQAAAIWGDVDARLYRRSAEHAYSLYAALPAGGRTVHPRELPATVIDGHRGPTRVTSIAELEQLGWQGPHGEVLFMPAPGGEGTEWLLAVGGAVDTRFERVLAVACRTLSLCLEELAARRLAQLRQRLDERLIRRGTSVPEKLAGALAELAASVRATRARLLVSEAADGPPLAIAEVGGRPFTSGTTLPQRASRMPHRLRVTIDVGLPAPATIEFETILPEPFDPSSRSLAEHGARIFGAWLTGALHGLSAARHGLDAGSMPGIFERRLHEELERARRFGLEAGVLVIDTTAAPREQHLVALDPVADVVREQLRASDVLGRLQGGELAALLVQTGADGVGVVASRLARQLGRLAAEARVPATIVGSAAFPGAGETVQALVTAACEDRDRRAADGSAAR